jgi:hypothetical protein
MAKSISFEHKFPCKSLSNPRNIGRGRSLIIFHGNIDNFSICAHFELVFVIFERTPRVGQSSKVGTFSK